MTTSGSAINIAVPSWANKITISAYEVSLSGSSDLLIRVGKTTPQTTGYLSTSTVTLTTGGASTGTSISSGWSVYTASAGGVVSGRITIEKLSDTQYVSDHSMKRSTTSTINGGGSALTANAIDILRITNTGSDTFDSGAIKVTFES